MMAVLAASPAQIGLYARSRRHQPAQPRCGGRILASHQSRALSAAVTLIETELLEAVAALGYPTSVFPGDEPARAAIDSSIERLEQSNPTPSPLQQPQNGGGPSSAIAGEWKLVYASSGTYVTRSKPAQALLAASKLPGVGVGDIWQQLSLLPAATGADAAPAAVNSGRPQLRASNAVRLALGPLGDWQIAINGSWKVVNGSLAEVTFDGYDLRLVGLLGLIRLPRMAKVSVPIRDGRTVDFSTTYLSEGVRVARGSSGNIFVFERRTSQAPS